MLGTLMNRLIRRILQRFSSYDERTYWSARSDPNSPAGWHDETLQHDIAYIREHLRGCREILEFGPGVGRTLPAHSRETRITGYDITGNYRDRLLLRAHGLRLDLTLDVAHEHAEGLPYADGSFDAAVASAVLQHQRPERIEQVMRELARVGGKVIVIASHCGSARRTRATHSFQHDYAAICARIGCAVEHAHTDKGRRYFVYRNV
jgi:SAM-dependent methyltransferase